MRLRGNLRLLVAAVCFGGVLAACSSGSSGSSTATRTGNTVPLVAAGSTGSAAYLVYWDQNEEVDFLSMPSGTQGQLMPAWDLNGQVCILPDGRFVGGYDPTLPAQHNLGSAKPYKQPADGEELDQPNGSFSGQTLYVPGPFKMPGQTHRRATRPRRPNGVFNNNQTYTGCAVDKAGNMFANDIATAQGRYPPPRSGRLVEWFAPDYTHVLHRLRPDVGRRGAPPHRRDRRPRPAGDDGRWPTTATCSCPTSAPRACCVSPIVPARPVPRSVPAGSIPADKVQASDVRQGNSRSPLGLPRTRPVAASRSAATSGIRPSAGCRARRQARARRGPVPGDVGRRTRGRAPTAVQPVRHGLRPRRDPVLHRHPHRLLDGLLTGCGPANYGGRVMKVTFTEGRPSTPIAVATGFDFPTSVTVCVPSKSVCPYPTGAIVAPLSGPSENPAPDAGPRPTPWPRPALAERSAPDRGPRSMTIGPASTSPPVARRGRPGGADRRALWPDAAARPRRTHKAAAIAVEPSGRWDWPTYGHDAQHTFHGRTTLTEARPRHSKWRGSSPPATR